MEAVAHTGPQPVRRSVAGQRWSDTAKEARYGTTPTKPGESAVLIPPSLAQPDFAYSRDSVPGRRRPPLRNDKSAAPISGQPPWPTTRAARLLVVVHLRSQRTLEPAHRHSSFAESGSLT